MLATPTPCWQPTRRLPPAYPHFVVLSHFSRFSFARFLSGAQGPTLLLALERHPSSLDLADDPRPYVYAVSPQGLIPRWRGSALAWPLLDTALAPDDSGILCALHRGDSFLVPDPATTRTRVAAYRWNGFGFSGWDAAAALARCRELWETPKEPGPPVIPGGDPSDG